MSKHHITHCMYGVCLFSLLFTLYVKLCHTVSTHRSNCNQRLSRYIAMNVTLYFTLFFTQHITLYVTQSVTLCNLYVQLGPPVCQTHYLSLCMTAWLGLADTPEEWTSCYCLSRTKTSSQMSARQFKSAQLAVIRPRLVVTQCPSPCHTSHELPGPLSESETVKLGCGRSQLLLCRCPAPTEVCAAPAGVRRAGPLS